ncbi:hypothetical protein AHAS_Ahas19G0110900 [Arachis hypogaea]
MSFLPQSPSASVTTSPVATITISGPTSFAPVIDAAIDVVEKSNGQYHVLVIIADGQVSRNPYIGGRKRLGPQEQATVNSIVAVRFGGGSRNYIEQNLPLEKIYTRLASAKKVK